MSVLAEPVSVNQPITHGDITFGTGDAPDPHYTDEAAIRIVLGDYETAAAWLADANWSLQWRESKILYQSPRGLATFEGSGVTRANVSRFTVAKQVNSLAPAINGAIFSDATPFQVRPRGQTTEKAAVAWREMLTALLDECDFKQEIANGVEAMTNQGTVIFKWGWERAARIEKHYTRKSAPATVDLPIQDKPMQIFTEESDEFEVEEVEVTRSRPWIDKCELGTVYIDPKWNKPNQLWKARWIVHEHYVTWDDLEILRQNDDYDIPSDDILRRIFLDLDQEQTEGIGAGEHQLTEVGSAIAHAERRDADTSEDPLLKPMQVLERWTKDDCMVLLNGKCIIRNGRHEFPEKPFGSANFWNMEDTGYGLGCGRISGSDQRVDQGTINAALDIISFAVNPEYAVSRGANAPTQDMRRRLGGVRPVDGDPRQAYALIEQPKVPSDVWTVTQLSREASESATGADQATVQGAMPGGKSSFGRSGTGAGLMGKASSGRIQAPVDRVLDGVCLPFIEFVWDTAREHLAISEMREILSDVGAADLIPDMHDFMNAKLKFDTLAGTRLAARQAMASALPFLLQVFENPQLIGQLNQTGYKVAVDELVGMVMDVSEWKNARQLVVKMTPQELQQSQQATNPKAGELQQKLAVIQAQQQGAQQLEDQKQHGRIVGDIVKQTVGKTQESPLDRAQAFATRDQLEHEMQQSAYFGGGQ